jgi:hypothetical protein
VGHIFKGKRVVFFAEAKIKAAGLGAKSAVSASSAKNGGKVAASGHTHAKSAVNERFKLDIGSFGNIFYLIKGKFS